MKTTSTCAALVLAAAATVPTSTAAAEPSDAGTSVAGAGCVSDGQYARLGIGQRLSYVRAVAGDEAQTSMRRWAAGANEYQERLYAMCTPWAEGHETLTTRFMYYDGAWRAFLVDTHVGPER